jgi:hypothetical protein
MGECQEERLRKSTDRPELAKRRWGTQVAVVKDEFTNGCLRMQIAANALYAGDRVMWVGRFISNLLSAVLMS